MQPPAYFERIRQKASSRWEQLEQDPELAGPWRQLFMQVQSPRHILSELLQNADDAGATEALACVQDQEFVFEHNGEDFTEEHFASLCRFGYSNKRALHTIGFRGIGFKSTFSLGGCVDLFTPSLAVRFDRNRFTEPVWLREEASAGRTRIRVRISDAHRQKELEKNLDEWLRSPISLLFFKNIRRIQIGDRSVHWGSLGPGPVPESQWMALYDKQDKLFLRIASEEVSFPGEALKEIRQERLLGSEEDMVFPPCKVEIVLGAEGRLYVVLPTGVETGLPFACNAPFIQDPARLKIKDPETSPTNRWLLERAGRLAATAMLTWLGKAESPAPERARAYGLLPDVDGEDGSLDGICGTTVEMAFAEAAEGHPLLLTQDERLAPSKGCISVPEDILEVWSTDEVSSLFDERRRPILSQHISSGDLEKLLNWGFVEEVDQQRVLDSLRTKRIPKPQTWRQLLKLWIYLEPEIRRYYYSSTVKDLHIVPVQGKDTLLAASEVVRLGEKKLLQSDKDWEFLAAHLLVLNWNWPRFLADVRRTEQDQDGENVSVEAAYAVLKTIGLDDTSDVNKVLERVSRDFFTQGSIPIKECVQLAQIAAKLNANVAGSLRYVTRDRRLRETTERLLFDCDGELEELLPELDTGVRPSALTVQYFVRILL